MLLDAADSGKAPAAPIDCLQYRSIYFQMNSAGTAGGNNTVNANFLPEASNDLVNWVNVAAVRLDGASAVGGTETRSINPVNYSGFAIFGANLMMRYFRLRCNSFSNSTFIQFTTTLRMTAMTYQINTFTNIGQQGGSGIGGASTMKAAGTQGDNIPPLIVGGLDRSIFRQELMGAMGAGGINNNYLTNGPYARNAYYDLAGAAGVAGPQPFLAEDKTYPVNVRLERTTNAQDSVQDLLQQILVELKALNYYTREIPLALNSGHLTSMDDDPENFFDDKTTARLTRGH